MRAQMTKLKLKLMDTLLISFKEQIDYVIVKEIMACKKVRRPKIICW